MSIGEWVLCVGIVAFCGVGWLVYSDYTAREERLRISRMEHEKAESERAARQAEIDRQERAEREVRLRAEREEQKLLEEKRREEEKARFEAEQRRQREERDAEQKRIAEQNELARRELEAREEERRKRDEERRKQQAAIEAKAREQSIETARAALLQARNDVARWEADKRNLETRLQGFINVIPNKRSLLKNVQAEYNHLLEERNSQRTVYSHGVAMGPADISDQVAKLRMRADYLEKEIKDGEVAVTTTKAAIKTLEVQLQSASDAKDQAEEYLRSQSVALDPTVPTPVKTYPVYCLNDGRRLTAVQAIKSEELISIKGPDGKMTTIKADQVKEIEPAEPVLPTKH